MGTRKTGALPAALEAARGAFQQWRESRPGRQRIPESLWAVAVQAAGAFGVNRTARALRIDHGRLKRRVLAKTARTAPTAAGVADMPTFVELPTAMGPNHGRCVVQLEDRTGSTMRIEVGTLSAADVFALARSFWEA